MRLFVSYARVDKPYCIQIVDTLAVHEIWYDHRLYAGQQWWREILRRLDWCEGFVYLLSPDSVGSEYCRREFELAQNLGKHIFPVLIHESTPIPAGLAEVQYANLSKGLTPEAVKILLSSIYVAERHKHPAVQSVANIDGVDTKAPIINPMTVISQAATAMEKGQFDHAVFLLEQAKAAGYKSKFINIDAVLLEAKTALERQAYLREAEREYKQIADLVKAKRTRNLGCEAFHAFSKDFPDYDPDSLTLMCEAEPVVVGPVSAPKPPDRPSFNLLELCEIPAGIVAIENSGKSNGKRSWTPFYVDAFKITKFPITNLHYQYFLDDPMGYTNVGWWQYSPHAHNWRMNNPVPKESKFKGDERPREMVNWYDAMAFCHWISTRLGVTITLPTQAQWQRAAQGDDNRLYPWGNEFDPGLCNTNESKLQMTTLVMRYTGGVSPYGVYDMAGNVWEWCLNGKSQSDKILLNTDEERAVHGGSFVSVYQRSQIPFHYFLKPDCHYASIGFRVVQLP